ncbi:calcium-binding protein [Phyllobacterium endophyticum]|nr:calcium-binding protein [Phyllobacterium endophyticum]
MFYRRITNCLRRTRCSFVKSPGIGLRGNSIRKERGSCMSVDPKRALQLMQQAWKMMSLGEMSNQPRSEFDKYKERYPHILPAGIGLEQNKFVLSADMVGWKQIGGKDFFLYSPQSERDLKADKLAKLAALGVTAAALAQSGKYYDDDGALITDRNLDHVIDSHGNFRGFNPQYDTAGNVTGYRLSPEGGSQLQVLAKYDNGRIVDLSVVTLGTNSTVDIAEADTTLQLKGGTAFTYVLNALRAVAQKNDIPAAKIIFTGYSLGGNVTSSLHEGRKDAAGGFFNDSQYIAFDSPSPSSQGNDGNYFYFGAENDLAYKLFPALTDAVRKIPHGTLKKFFDGYLFPALIANLKTFTPKQLDKLYPGRGNKTVEELVRDGGITGTENALNAVLGHNFLPVSIPAVLDDLYAITVFAVLKLFGASNSTLLTYLAPPILNILPPVKDTITKTEVLKLVHDLVPITDSIALNSSVTKPDSSFSYNNLVLFDDPYNQYGSLRLDTHGNMVLSNALDRLVQSTFVDEFSPDSAIVLSGLAETPPDNAGSVKQPIWVDDKEADSSDHFRLPAFILGRQGNADDYLSDGSGDDGIEGYGGNDAVKLSTGNDTVFGGAGNDRVEVKGSVKDYKILTDDQGTLYLQSSTYGLKELHDVEKLHFDGYSATDFDVNSASRTISGTTTKQTLQTYPNGNNLVGDALDNTISGGKGDDLIIGGGGNDVLTGGSDNDTIYGGMGNDMLNGGTGNDLLSGGYGRDTFIFDRVDWGRDIIEDFGSNQFDADSLEFSKNVFASIADVLGHAHASGQATVIDNGRSTLTLTGVSLADFTKSASSHVLIV